MKNYSILFLTSTLCISLFGCSNAANVDAFLLEYKNSSNEMAKAFNVGDYDRAKSIFEANRESLRSHCLAVKDNVGDKRKWIESFQDNIDVIGNALEAGGKKTDIPNMERMVALAKQHGSICKS
jgi:hypothetical protein